MINRRKKVSWRQNIVLREEQPPENLVQPLALGNYLNIPIFVDEVTNPQQLIRVQEHNL